MIIAATSGKKNKSRKPGKDSEGNQLSEDSEALDEIDREAKLAILQRQMAIKYRPLFTPLLENTSVIGDQLLPHDLKPQRPPPIVSTEPSFQRDMAVHGNPFFAMSGQTRPPGPPSKPRVITSSAPSDLRALLPSRSPVLSGRGARLSDISASSTGSVHCLTDGSLQSDNSDTALIQPPSSPYLEWHASSPRSDQL